MNDSRLTRAGQRLSPSGWSSRPCWFRRPKGSRPPSSPSGARSRARRAVVRDLQRRRTGQYGSARRSSMTHGVADETENGLLQEHADQGLPVRGPACRDLFWCSGVVETENTSPTVPDGAVASWRGRCHQGAEVPHVVQSRLTP